MSNRTCINDLFAGKEIVLSMLRIGTWNTQWAGPGTLRGQRIRVALAEPGCDIVCVTEGYEKILPRGGHVIDAGPDWGNPIKEGCRKVLLWSKRPWADVKQFAGRPLGGRLVAGSTVTDAGPLTIVGVCIPWSMAFAKGAAKDSKPWEEHGKWLSGFEALPYRDTSDKTVVLGDFNQRIPRRSQPRHVYEKLRRAFDGFEIATAGRLAGAASLAIDHIAHTPDLKVMGDVGVWPARSEQDKPLSDHFGVWSDFDDFNPRESGTASTPGRP